MDSNQTSGTPTGVPSGDLLASSAFDHAVKAYDDQMGGECPLSVHEVIPHDFFSCESCCGSKYTTIDCWRMYFIKKANGRDEPRAGSAATPKQ